MSKFWPLRFSLSYFCLIKNNRKFDALKFQEQHHLPVLCSFTFLLRALHHEQSYLETATFTKQSCIRCYHIYKGQWEVAIGGKLVCQ